MNIIIGLGIICFTWFIIWLCVKINKYTSFNQSDKNQRYDSESSYEVNRKNNLNNNECEIDRVYSELYPKNNYSDLLKQPEWQEKRQEILKRDGYKCCYCGSTDKLCVHHKYYLQYPNHKKVKPWNYPNDALITLCNKCHYKVHKRKPVKVYYKKYDTDS